MGALPGAASGPARESQRRQILVKSVGALTFTLLCYAVMTALVLWAEMRQAPTLPDLMVSALPYVPWIDRVNYLAWLLAMVPILAAFFALEPERWARCMVAQGLLCLARGVCIALTGFGPPNPLNAGPGLEGTDFLSAYLSLLSPVGLFFGDAPHVFLSKDMFFSGHTSTSFLVLLYVWHRPRLRWAALLAHVAMVAAVALAHRHYAIDIVAAYAFSFALFAMREWQPRSPRLRAAVARSEGRHIGPSLEPSGGRSEA